MEREGGIDRERVANERARIEDVKARRAATKLGAVLPTGEQKQINELPRAIVWL